MSTRKRPSDDEAVLFIPSISPGPFPLTPGPATTLSRVNSNPVKFKSRRRSLEKPPGKPSKYSTNPPSEHSERDEENATEDERHAVKEERAMQLPQLDLSLQGIGTMGHSNLYSSLHHFLTMKEVSPGLIKRGYSALGSIRKRQAKVVDEWALSTFRKLLIPLENLEGARETQRAH